MYSLTWLIYAAASLVALGCFFWLTKGISHAVVRWLIRMPFVALCFTPVQVPGAEDYWFAPAIAALALELVKSNPDAISQFTPALMFTIALSLVIGLLMGIFLQRKNKKNGFTFLLIILN